MKYIYVVVDTVAAGELLGAYSSLKKAKQVAEREVIRAKEESGFEWDFYGSIEIHKIEIDNPNLIDVLSDSNCVWHGK